MEAMMKRSRFRCCVLASCLALAAGLSAQEAQVSGSASFGLFNRYVIRGYRIGADNGAAESSLTVNYAGFSATYWGNVDFKEEATPDFIPDRPGRRSMDEVDLILSYSRSFGNWNLTAGYIYYDLKYAPETQEFYAGAGYNTFGKPTLTIYRDTDAYPGTYINLSFSQSIPLKGAVTLDLGASASYMAGSDNYWRTYDPDTEAYTGDKYRAFHDGMLKAGLTVPLTRKISLQPMVQYWIPLSSDAKKSVDGCSCNPNGRLENTFVYGATFLLTF
jgi:hypothetical protein